MTRLGQIIRQWLRGHEHAWTWRRVSVGIGLGHNVWEQCNTCAATRNWYYEPCARDQALGPIHDRDCPAYSDRGACVCDPWPKVRR